MSFPRYPEYKDSGCKRLGQVPDHWNALPCRAIVNERNRKNEYGKVTQYLSLMANIGIICYENKGDIGNKKPDDLSKCKIVNKGDLVINSMNYGIGSYGLSPLDGVCSAVYIVLDPVEELILERFALRIFEEKEFQAYAQSFGNGILAHRSAIGWDDIKNIKIGLPAIVEQTHIALFLDHETARIDALIEQQQRLIELLKEKQQAMISHTVTKGLDPTVPMKNSGVEWFGQVPKHWKVTKLGHYSQILTGFPFPSESFSHDESDIRLLRGANIGVGTLRWFDTVYWRLSENENLTSYLMEEGQIVLGMDRPWISEGMRIARITGEDIPCLLLQRVAAITPKAQLDDMFLFYLLASELFRAYVEPDLTGVSVPHISPEQIMSFQIPLPEIEEQRRIGEYVSKQLDRMTALFKQATESIELLQERRSALISVAVTGKIDVRNWQPPRSRLEQEMQQEVAHG